MKSQFLRLRSTFAVSRTFQTYPLSLFKQDTIDLVVANPPGWSSAFFTGLSTARGIHIEEGRSDYVQLLNRVRLFAPA